MPVCFVEGPAGLGPEARRDLVQGATRAIHAAYPIPDTRVVVRANAPEDVGQDGALGERARPMCFLEVPPGLASEARRTLVRELTRAVDAAYGERGGATLVFFREYPLHQVALDGTLQSENPRLAAALRGSEAAAR